ncbi:hypothetical protein B3286c2_0829 [Brucella vulpis]|nr:hypothetical protein BF3285c2_0834 [Brucella vulpis]CUW51837.1 hypothetical protein B3286c2_0829 [Brucella vulpis]
MRLPPVRSPCAFRKRLFGEIQIFPKLHLTGDGACFGGKAQRVANLDRGSDGAVYIDGRGGGNCRQLCPVDGRDDRHYIPVGSGLPAAVDE